jgi:hypothetical protein
MWKKMMKVDTYAQSKSSCHQTKVDAGFRSPMMTMNLYLVAVLVAIHSQVDNQVIT